MRVQALKLADYRPVFKQNENKNQDMDRPVTVQDLCDMEKRLTAHMNENYKKQNKMLGKVTYDLADLIFYHNIDFLDDARRSAASLSRSVSS